MLIKLNKINAMHILVCIFFVVSILVFFPLDLEGKIWVLYIYSILSGLTSFGAYYWATWGAKKVQSAEQQGKEFIKSNLGADKLDLVWPKLQASLNWYSALPESRKDDIKRGALIVIDLLEGKLKRMATRGPASEDA